MKNRIWNNLMFFLSMLKFFILRIKTKLITKKTISKSIYSVDVIIYILVLLAIICNADLNLSKSAGYVFKVSEII